MHNAEQIAEKLRLTLRMHLQADLYRGPPLGLD
jgi:hypothetical protein